MSDIAEAMDFRKNLRRLYKIFDGTLTEREKRVLILRYGMFGGEEKTQREIAEKLHISRSYVSRIEKGALEKLKKRLDSEEVFVRRSFPAQGPEVPQKRYLQIFHL